MIIFSKYQLRRWIAMLDHIVCYQKGGISFCSLVGRLEGEWSLGEFNHELCVQWDALWLDLEIMNAVELDGRKVPQQDKDNDINKCYHFLKQELVKQMSSVIEFHQQSPDQIPFPQIAEYFETSLGFEKHLNNATEWELCAMTLNAAQHDCLESKNERMAILAQMKKILEPLKP